MLAPATVHAETWLTFPPTENLPIVGVVVTGLSLCFIGISRLRTNQQSSRSLEEDCNNTGELRIVWDTEGRITERNITARRFLIEHSNIDAFLKQPSLLGNQITDFSKLTAKLKQVPSVKSDNLLQASSRSVRWLSWTHQAIRDDKGQVLYYISLGTDISYLRARVDDLNMSHGVFLHTHDGIMLQDLDGRIKQVNPAFVKLTGRQPEEVIGNPPTFLRSELPPAEFFTSIQHALAKQGQWKGEIWGRHQDGQVFPCELSFSYIQPEDTDNSPFILGRFVDISAQKEQEKKITRLSYYDQLTELPNRALFMERLKNALTRADRHNKHVPIMVINLIRFKQINESLGHEAGDRMLQKVSSRMAGCVRKSDTVARIGGDLFGVIIDPLGGQSEVINISTRISEHILQSLSRPIDLDGFEAYTSAVIGIVTYPDDGQNVSDLLKNADAAVHHAKSLGPNHALFYEPRMNEKSKQRLQLVGDIRKGLERGEFELYYQPTIDLALNQVTGTEALIRWNHPHLGQISPAEFIPLAEETGLIIPLGEWIFAEALRQAKAWQDDGVPPLRMAINLSVKQLRQPDLAVFIDKMLKEMKLAPGSIAMELTESCYMEDTQVTRELLQSLARLGIDIHIDDFGTGYSSLARLAQLPASTIKIDRSFLMDIEKNQNNESLVSAIIAMAHNLGMTIIAEGIETNAQYDMLKRLRCEEVQGFLISKPLPANECTYFLKQTQKQSVSLPEQLINNYDGSVSSISQAWKKSP